MEQIVLDTSVVAKLFLKEELSSNAIRLKDKHIKGEIEIVAPSLLKYELINALKSKRFTKVEIKEALEAVRDYGFSIVDPEDQALDNAAALAVDYNISSYDASYVALAKDLESELCTADGKLVEKASRLNFVKHLSEF